MKTSKLRYITTLVAWNCTLFVTLCCVVIAGVEAYLRISIPRSTGTPVWERTAEDDRYKLMKRNFVSYPYGIEFRTNELGFRDNKSAVPAKSEHDTRIIVLGDSFTAAAGVPFDALFTSLVEAKLREHHSGIQVLNLAVGGYEPVRYRKVFERMRSVLDPDVVVAAIYPENDFSNHTYEYDRLRALGLDEPEQSRCYESLYVYRAYLWRVVARAERIVKADRERQKIAEGDRQHGPTPDWDENADAIKAISRIARESGLEFVVVLLPETARNLEDRALESRYFRVVQLCHEENIPCLNLLSRFAAAGVEGNKLRLNAIDAHPNAKYHALVAEYLSPFLEGVLAGNRDSFIMNEE